MVKLNIQSFFGPGLATLMLSISACATWLCLIDRVIAVVNQTHGEPSLTLTAGVAMFGWAAVILVVFSVSAAIFHRTSRLVSSALSAPALEPYFTAMLLGAAFIYPFFIVGRDLAAGDWISHQSYGWAVHAAPAVFGPLGAAFLGWLFFRFDAQTDPRPWRRRCITALFLLVSFACTGICLNLPYGAYPNFIVLLFALSLAAMLAAVHRIAYLSIRRLSGRFSLILTATALLLIAFSSIMAVTMNRKTRSELAMKSPTMGPAAGKTGRMFSVSLLQNSLQIIEMTSTLNHPEDALPRGLIKVGDDWNILLMVVDCLRADALFPNRKKGQKHAKDGDTPFLDGLIKESYTFSNAYAQGSRTMKSMPAMFRSLETFDNPLKKGVALGTYAKSLGKTPVAVVNDVFARPWRESFQELLLGFEHVSIFEEKEIASEVDRAMEIFTDETVRPFFAWLHFQSVHTPYFDGRLLSRKDGSTLTRYRRGLKWADRQMKHLFLELDRIGILDKTIVILASDHGENLGDNPAQSHGFSVFEEAIKVPLAIRIPGHKGRIIDQTVGNIDLVPTIADLLGAPLNPSHRGRSLVPLMVNPKREWRRTYFTRNAVGKMFSVVREKDKLICDVDADTIYRFDLSTDPAEDHNLYSPNGKLDQELLFSALTASPKQFAEELETTETKQLLEEKILGIDPKHSGGALDFLTSLAAKSSSKKIEAHLLRVYRQTNDDDARLLLQQNLFATNPKAWTSALVSSLEQISGTQRELAFVDRLAAQGQPAFRHQFVAKRLAWWMRQSTPASMDPWLRLISRWQDKPEQVYGTMLTELLVKLNAKNAGESFSSERLALVLENIHSTNWKSDFETKKKALEATHSLFEYPDPIIKRSVYKVLGKIGDAQSVAMLTAVFKATNLPIRIRQGALHAIVDLTRDEAVPLILEYCTEAKLQSDAIVLLRELGNPQGIPMLKSIQKNHPKNTYRKAAARAIKEIRKKN